MRRGEVVEEREQWRVKRAFRVRQNRREYDNTIAFAGCDSTQDWALWGRVFQGFLKITTKQNAS